MPGFSGVPRKSSCVPANLHQLLRRRLLKFAGRSPRGARTCNPSTPTSIITNPKFKRPSAPTKSRLFSVFPQDHRRARSEKVARTVLRRRLMTMSQVLKTLGWLRVFGIDPPPPPGRRAMESLRGRRSTLPQASVVLSESRRTANRMCGRGPSMSTLAFAFDRRVLSGCSGVESVFTALNMRTALTGRSARPVILLAAP